MRKRRITKYMLLALVLAIIFAVSACSVPAVSYSYGSSGAKVQEIQTRLKNWGYYSGSIDGVYGSATTAAVKWFQRNNGITVDGVVGSVTAEKLGIALGSSSTSSGTSGASSDIYLLARAVYGEARGEAYKGQVAIAAVILNRVESSSFPNTIAKVIYQPGAFTIVSDGQINLTPDNTAITAAKDAMNGYDPTGGALFYYNPSKTTNAYMLSKTVTLVIGNHNFCK